MKLRPRKPAAPPRRAGGPPSDAEWADAARALARARIEVKAAIAGDKESHRALVQDEQPQTEPAPDGGNRPRVSLTQRALPLLAMLEESLKERKPVVWGV